MAKLVVRVGVNTMPDDMKDRLIAPHFSQLTAPKIPDISGERKYVLSAFILNAKLAVSIPNGLRQHVFNFIRKSEDAFDEYAEAGRRLKQHVAAKNQTVSPYFAALRHFEHCLGHLYEAVLCVNGLRLPGHEKQFDKADGSVLDRVFVLHNHVKHMDTKFRQGKYHDEQSFTLFATGGPNSRVLADSDIPDVASVPIWLTNNGLECRAAALTYRELADEILGFHSEAAEIATVRVRHAGAPP
jgi:hypothetical protein